MYGDEQGEQQAEEIVSILGWHVATLHGCFETGRRRMSESRPSGAERQMVVDEARCFVTILS